MMKDMRLPQGYKPLLSIYETQRAIDLGNRLFADKLAGALRLHRVSAPLFVAVSSGLNDDLNGVERAVAFDINGVEGDAAVVHSLAKWKRFALKRYQFHVGEGLYTNMNAIRRDEELDCLHSAYVDQWDWEKIIDSSERHTDYLKQTVCSIVGALFETQSFLRTVFPQLNVLPSVSTDIAFVTSQELEDLFPDKTPKQREDAFVKDHPTTFLMGIGGKLKSGKPHDGRAPDYDDWDLNGDLLVWDSVGGRSFEVSSMGIRVDEESLARQLELAGVEVRLNTEATPELLHELAPEALILAVGSSPIVPPLPGIDGDNVVIVNNYYLEKEKVGDSVVVLGGGLAGCECAVHLGMEGKAVHLVEMRDSLAVDCNIRHRPILMEKVDRYATVHLEHAGLRITPEGLVCRDKEGREVLIPGETVICAVGQRSNRDAVMTLRSCAPWVRKIGDCNRVSNITNAVYQGYHAALDI